MFEWIANELLTYFFQGLSALYASLIAGFEYANDSESVKIIYVVFGSFSGAIFTVALVFAFFRLNVNKVQGRGSYLSFMESVFYGILHTSSATALLPVCFSLFSSMATTMTNGYLDTNREMMTETLVRNVMEKNVSALTSGVHIFPVFFIFSCAVVWLVFKVLLMSFENFGIIIAQTCIFSLLVYDTVLNEGVGTMRFFKVAIGTVLGQSMMLFFAVIGMVLMFQGDNFIIGIALLFVAPKMTKIVPSYLGATGRLAQSGKAFDLNMSMLRSAAQLAGGAIG